MSVTMLKCSCVVMHECGVRHSHKVYKGACEKYCGDRKKGVGGKKALTMQNVNPCVVKLQYAVRGPLVARAGAIEEELKKGAKKPFKQVIRANLGDAHAMGQQPITFLRQVVACAIDPCLIENSDYPEDVKKRAKQLLGICAGGSMGSYTMSFGLAQLRKDVAKYIAKRDGHPSDWNKVVLSTGATSAIKNILELFANAPMKTGIMVPIPQYPLYSATLAEYGIEKVDYYLDEEHNWGLDIKELERAYKEASKKMKVRAIVVINPGNPTGQVLTRKSIEGVLDFAAKHTLLVFADEVYQTNVYDKDSKFYSFKKILMESKHKKTLEMVSFMSASKGYTGECGMRGGWMEIMNMDPDVETNLFKMISATLCPNTPGQAMIGCIARPPAEGEPSYERWLCEKNQVLSSLAERAQLVFDTFKKMEGFKCNTVQGAMYAFPRFELPKKALEAAKKAKKPADVFYAFTLLEETGICIVPGSGFGQRPGTLHFRTTILAQTPLLKQMLKIFEKFHRDFTKKYS